MNSNGRNTPWIAATILTGIVMLASMGVNIYFKGQIDSLAEFKAELRTTIRDINVQMNENARILADHEARLRAVERISGNTAN